MAFDAACWATAHRYGSAACHCNTCAALLPTVCHRVSIQLGFAHRVSIQWGIAPPFLCVYVSAGPAAAPTPEQEPETPEPRRTLWPTRLDATAAAVYGDASYVDTLHTLRRNRLQAGPQQHQQQEEDMQEEGGDMGPLEAAAARRAAAAAPTHARLLFLDALAEERRLLMHLQASVSDAGSWQVVVQSVLAWHRGLQTPHERVPLL